METLINILIERDGITRNSATIITNNAKTDYYNRIKLGYSVDISSFMAYWFGLEEDWFDTLIPGK